MNVGQWGEGVLCPAVLKFGGHLVGVSLDKQDDYFGLFFIERRDFLRHSMAVIRNSHHAGACTNFLANADSGRMRQDPDFIPPQGWGRWRLILLRGFQNHMTRSGNV